MEDLKIQPTDSSFAIDLDVKKSQFTFQGESRPENAPGFFDPVINWLQSFKNSVEREENQIQLEVVFKLDYFNSTSTKYIVDIAKILKAIGDSSKVVLDVKWYYKEIDEDIKESGIELSEWTDLKIEMIPFD